jgi:hypothetical protein
MDRWDKLELLSSAETLHKILDVEPLEMVGLWEPNTKPLEMVEYAFTKPLEMVKYVSVSLFVWVKLFDDMFRWKFYVPKGYKIDLSTE